MQGLQYQDRLDNIRSAVARGLPGLPMRDWSDRPYVQVGGGPSLKYTWGAVAYHMHTDNIIVANDVHEFLRERGVTFHGCYVNEVLPKQARLFDNVLPDVTYYVASQSHPSTFDKLLAKGANIVVWHLAENGVVDLLGELGVNEPAIGGGGSAGLRMLNIATHYWGARDVHWHGYDGSAGGQSHAYEHRVNLTVPVWCAGREFLTNTYLVRQTVDFIEDSVPRLPKGTDVQVHGDGLLPHAYRTGGKVEVFAGQKPVASTNRTPLPPREPALAYLRRAVQETGASVVLEFGSGHSTVALNEAVGAAGRLVSLESDAFWATNTRNMLGMDGDKVRLRQAEIVDHGGWAAWRYDMASFDDIVPDLIFMDGPRLSHPVPFCCNVLEMEHRLRPGCRLVIDKRPAQCLFHEHMTTRRWRKTMLPDERLVVYELLDGERPTRADLDRRECYLDQREENQAEAENEIKRRPA